MAFDINPVAGENTFYVNDGGTWKLFNQVDSFTVKKRLNQVSEFEVKLFDVTSADKAFFKEQSEVLFFSGTTMILKARIQTIEYSSSYEVIARGFGMEALLMDKQFEVTGRLLKEDGDFILTEDGKTILFLQTRRLAFNDFSAKEIAVEINSNILTTASSGIFDTDYGNVSMRFEYANRLKSFADLAETINWDWWTSQTSSDDYDEDFINLASSRGATTSQQTYDVTTNTTVLSQERDITNLSNFVTVLGYGDGINQLNTSVFAASTQSSILDANIESTDTSILLLDSSDFDNTGTARIAEEQITYAGISSNTLTGCARAVNQSTARQHFRNCYIEQQFAKDAPQTGSSIQLHGLMEDVTIDKTLQNLAAAELIASKRIIERKDPIQRIDIIPDEPFEEVALVDIGDLVTVTGSESELDGDFRIAGINYINNFGSLNLELQVSNRSLEFVEQVNKQREGEQNLGKYMQGATNIYTIHESENADENIPLNVRFYMPRKVEAINKVFLSFKMVDYRYADASGVTEVELTDPSVDIYVGEDESESFVVTANTDQEEINITDFVPSSQKWFNVRFEPNKKMKLDVNITIQAFLESV